MNRVADDEVLPSAASVAIDGSKFKAVNTRDKNFTRAKVERRHAPCAANGEGSGVRSTALRVGRRFLPHTAAATLPAG